MCTVINADCVLANALHGRQSITIAEIKLISKRVVRDNPNVYVDVCMQTLCWAVDRRPDMFVWTGERIRRGKAATQEFSKRTVNAYFNWRIPMPMRKEFVAACQRSPRRVTRDRSTVVNGK